MMVCKPYGTDRASWPFFCFSFPLFFGYVIYQLLSHPHPGRETETLVCSVVFGFFGILPLLFYLLSVRVVRYNETYGDIIFERIAGDKMINASDITEIRITTWMSQAGPHRSSLSFKFIWGGKSITVSNLAGLGDMTDALQKAYPKIIVLRP